MFWNIAGEMMKVWTEAFKKYDMVPSDPTVPVVESREINGIRVNVSAPAGKKNPEPTCLFICSKGIKQMIKERTNGCE